ncbi:MAG: DNA gyrase inhibitor YacG [Pseudomonadota bacterium]|uniref:DNA gyrase inhibitor YacG n=1 Tax=Thermithiobacillus tepidarius TaxID=929 RepID=UPI0003FAA8B7|nr:DNA gyrase inhibitor YacG [Thermithiobacillus tepidarius]
MSNKDQNSGRTLRPCPQCHKPAPWEGNPYRPFCSERCRLLDLGAWASEQYRVPAEEAPPGDAVPKDEET